MQKAKRHEEQRLQSFDEAMKPRLNLEPCAPHYWNHGNTCQYYKEVKIKLGIQNSKEQT
jgi:hypothetical protein